LKEITLENFGVQVASVVELLREGRAALHTSFACYKFLIIYGLSFSIFKLTANWYILLYSQQRTEDSVPVL
jgi:magnesium-transporting ATPase (P-type)